MNKCPITYQPCGDKQYSDEGLKLLNKRLETLHPLPFTAQELRGEAAIRMKKMSIQGVQPKLSAILSIRKTQFEIVDMQGKYIIKPQSDFFQSVPEIEDLTMKMAKVAGIETPIHGMVYSKDGSLNYFIKRFDRVGNRKVAVEDFSQLAGLSRATKYQYSIEKVVGLIDQYCTFPTIEKVKFFRLILFCFLTGNEDMHLKNFSLITRKKRIELSPAYDLLNSTLAMGGATEEMALTLAGKKSRFKRKELIDYLGKERLELPLDIIEKVEVELQNAFPIWKKLITDSFLNTNLQKEYLDLINQRFKRIK